MRVINETSDQDQVKICLYRLDDNVDWIPVGAGVFIVKKGETVPWTAPSGEGLDGYHMKAFHPAFIDQCLAALDVNFNEDLAIRGGNGSYSIDKL
ncbi:hypothetical protein [Vibrio nereis]|uniref:hypothetical protein n=1 Tax=Vibrio nereis TaxID=693 RepID=UPI0024941E15|nr:hypothetical protein [Vibrio nereis]